MFRRSLICLLLVTPAVRAAVQSVTVDPVSVQLQGSAASWSLLVHGRTTDGHTVDLTRNARFRGENDGIARVTAAGVIHAAGDGTTTIRVEIEGKTLAVAVAVNGTTLPRRLTYQADVLPIFSRHGCNASGCHGKAEGQNGFKLSVFGFDPAADHAALIKEDRGRRVFPGAPEASLLAAQDVSGQMPHGGGARIRASPPITRPSAPGLPPARRSDLPAIRSSSRSAWSRASAALAA